MDPIAIKNEAHAYLQNKAAEVERVRTGILFEDECEAFDIASRDLRNVSCWYLQALAYLELAACAFKMASNEVRR